MPCAITTFFVKPTLIVLGAYTPLLLLRKLFFLVGLTLFISPFSLAEQNTSDTNTDKNQELNSVQAQIKQQRTSLVKNTQQRLLLEKKLKQGDLAISQVAKEINKIQTDIKTVQIKIATLAKTKQTLTKQKKYQENLLAKQLQAAYSSGNHDYLKLLLNQQKSASVQRTITYYEYLNAARIKEIDQFQITISTLLQVTSEHEEQISSLEQLKINQNLQRLTLQETKDERQVILKEVNKDLLSGQQQLAQLESQERSLVSALKHLESLVREQANLNGLSKLTHKLKWPVNGRLIRSFGSQKRGYITWKGVLMSAPVGRQVSTIHNGTVLFSDWLKGYGLVMVIDHGNGYMSLYGHNQTLLKNTGDNVVTGETIALVGQSGGQSQPGLYFEIRHRGKAVNPKTWCQK